MKEGWDIKNVGSVAEITDYVANGSFATLRENVSYLNEEGYAILVRLADYTNKFDKSKYVYIDEHAYNFLSKSKLFGGEIIMSNVGSIGKSFICPDLGMPMSLAPNSIVIRTSNNHFYHYLFQSKWFFSELQKISSKTALPKLNKTSFKNIQIPVPSLSEQESIVAELDCLSGVIEKQKQQLKELDNLAQAIFYDMFGDPITNEKGWEVKKLEDVSTLLNGRAYKQHELLNEGKYKVLRVGNFFTNDNYYYSDLELEDSKYCDNGDLLFAWSASFGAFIWNGGKVIYHYHIWKVLYDVKVLNIEYYKFLLNAMTTYFMKDVHGIGMVHLTKCGMEQYILPLPPLSLQQEFASKIEAIEKQKELIIQSISETEILFNSRMDYYFN